jgi:hypothetical protein
LPDDAHASSVTGIPIVQISKWIGALLAAAAVAPAFAASVPAPVIVTLDARDYVTYAVTALTPSASRLAVDNSGIANCHRGNGDLPASGKWKLHRSADSLDVDFETLRVEFNPTRVVLDSSTHDVVCDGEAMGWQTGLGRLFRDDFDA